MEKIFSSVHISVLSLQGSLRIRWNVEYKTFPYQVPWRLLKSCGCHVALPPIFIGSIHLKESIPIKGYVHLKEFVPIKESVHFKGSVRLSAFHSRQDSVYQVFDCQAIWIVSRCHRRFIISLANWIRLLQDLFLSTVKVEHVEQCQGRYLTTPQYLMTH